MTVRIVTDSASDLTHDEATALGIDVVPLSIRFGDDVFLDSVELSIDEFYRRMADSEDLPQTAAPAPGAFQEVFRRRFADGADAIVCINLSSGVSATMESAELAARETDGDVRVVDSRSVTAGLGMMVLAAAEAAAGGAGADEIVGLMEAMRERTRVFGAIDTMENLKKGGRIGNAQADDIDDLVGMLSPLVDPSATRVGVIGPVVASHGGPGVIGLCFTLRA